MCSHHLAPEFQRLSFEGSSSSGLSGGVGGSSSSSSSSSSAGWATPGQSMLGSSLSMANASPSGLSRALSPGRLQRPTPLSRNSQGSSSPSSAPNVLQPAVTHTISHNGTSVLSLVVDEDSGLVFSGSQAEDIYVWDLRTYQERTRLEGHTASVLSLELCPEKGWLFSASGDSTVRIWDTHTLAPLFVIYPADDRVGDIFALKWCSALQTLYFGCQNTSIQWITLASIPSASGGSAHASSVPIVRPHKFFDSGPRGSGGSQTRLSMSGASTPMGGRGTPRASTPPVHVGSLRRGLERASTSPDVPTLSSSSSGGGGAGRSSSPGSSPTSVPVPFEALPVRALQVPARNMVPSAHSGYVYALELLAGAPGSAGATKPTLVSGSGDEDIKLWSCTPDGLILHATLHNSANAVLALAAWGDGTLFAGLQGGAIEVWDIETERVVKTLPAHADDVLALTAYAKGSERVLYSVSADGGVRRWESGFRCTTEWRAHDGIILSVAAPAPSGASATLLTGASDHAIKVWDVPLGPTTSVAPANTLAPVAPFGSGDALLGALARFVSFRSVSSDESAREECRQCAHWLKAHLADLGADTALLPGAEGRNPLVLATFRASGSRLAPRRRVVAYAHYDVITPGPAEGWTSSPWSLAGRDGYLHARGVSDNKGPCLAIAHAAAELAREGKLNADVVLLVEGEEESDGKGFLDAVRAAREQIGHVDVVLLSNSYWLGENTPCLTVGLRGVVQAEIDVSCGGPDVHSGVDGGAVREPMIDMLKLVSSLTDGDRVLIPSFYASVRPVTASERELYAHIARMKQSRASGWSADALMKRWRHPSLSVHRVAVSAGSSHGNATVIPARVAATISLRLVPDQDLDQITGALVQDIEKTFEGLKSPNVVKVNIKHRADWWLGVDTAYSSALADAVEAEWGIPPVTIREGGSIPALAILEKELGAPAVHLPMGQASDRAHLSDERLRLVNLQKGKAVVRRWLCSTSLSSTGAAPAPTSAAS